MIIQALNNYYNNHLKNNTKYNIPPFGFSTEKIHFALVINESGKLIDIKDLRDRQKKKNFPKELIVPAGDDRLPGLNIPRTSGINPHFMWDNKGYVLGTDSKKFKAFKEFQYGIGKDVKDDGMQATLKFINSWNPKNVEQLKYWKEMEGANIVFQLDGERKFIHDHLAVKEKWLKYCAKRKSEYISEAFCLASGEEKLVTKIHPSIKGIPPPAKPSGASMVSFNLDSFCSYNKKQSFNAPVSKEIAFSYTTALNYLLRYESRNKVKIGDTTIVFWTEGSTPMINFLKDILDPIDNQADPDLRIFLESVRDGKMPEEKMSENIEDSKDMKFYILGLSPNASRLSVRFWYVSTVKDIIIKLGQHFNDLAISKNYENEPEFPGMWHLLHELAPQRDVGKLSPLLAGLFFKSILAGERYPSNLLSIIINRIRAEQSLKNQTTGKTRENVTYLRASMIKAYIIRNSRFKNKKEREVKMSLNREENDIGYLLGRLFAACEKAQQDALGKNINATIKDKFYSSSSTTPGAVFPRLLRLSQYHLRSIDNQAFRVSNDNLMQGIISNIPKFPPYLNLEEQGMFALGYYHQKQNFYKKLEKKEEESNG